MGEQPVVGKIVELNSIPHGALAIKETAVLPVRPSLHVRAVLVVACMSLAQIEGALKKMREVLQAYERGDWVKLERMLPH